MIPGVACGVWGLVNVLILPNRPAEVGIETEAERIKTQLVSSRDSLATKQVHTKATPAA